MLYTYHEDFDRMSISKRACLKTFGELFSEVKRFSLEERIRFRSLIYRFEIENQIRIIEFISE